MNGNVVLVFREDVYAPTTCTFPLPGPLVLSCYKLSRTSWSRLMPDRTGLYVCRVLSFLALWLNFVCESLEPRSALNNSKCRPFRDLVCVYIYLICMYICITYLFICVYTCMCIYIYVCVCLSVHIHCNVGIHLYALTDYQGNMCTHTLGSGECPCSSRLGLPNSWHQCCVLCHVEQ